MLFHIEYSDGSNPYICFNEKELNRLRKKYGKRMVELKKGFWRVERSC